MTIQNAENRTHPNLNPIDQKTLERKASTQKPANQKGNEIVNKKAESKHALNENEKVILETKGYKVSNSLGSGGYGKVYVGHFHTKTGRPHQLACKVIDTVNAGESYVKKFLPRELAIMVKVSHPHIIQLHSILTNESKIYIFMRYAENGDLSSYLKKNGAISEDLGRVWTRQLALALQYLHIMNIAHRDIKAKNVLITSNMNVKLCDFGFSRLMLDEKGEYILSKSFCGTMTYLAPEVLLHKEYDAKAADMWSLGVLMFTMLNNRSPFRLIKGRIQVKAQMQKKYRYTKQLSDSLKKVIDSLLDPDPNKRWTSTDVVQSEWIAMKKDLLFMDQREYDAFMAAADFRQIHEAALTNIIHKFRRTTTHYRANNEVKERFPTPSEVRSFYKTSNLIFSVTSPKYEVEFSAIVSA